MYAKLIVCSVDPTFKQRFSLAQTAWSECSDSSGFKLQMGGWDIDQERAIIVSYWNDKKSLSAFMNDKHDEIASKSKQVQTYTKCAITHLKELSPIVGKQVSENRYPEVLRLTDCRVLPEKLQHFFDVQTSIWQPGMQMSEGFCGGFLCKHDTDSHRFFVITLWSTLDTHTHYVNQALPKLKVESNLAQTMSTIQSTTVALQNDWEFAQT